MRIAVTGKDLRFAILRQLLERDGHTLVSPEEAELVVPPPWDGAARYARSESYLIANAALTAQGAAELLGREVPLPGRRVLILGYGRVGRLTARALREGGCAVTAMARDKAQRAWARAEGCAAADFSALPELLGRAEIVVNTVPAPVLRSELLARTRADAVLLELASAPGGIDAAEARVLGRTYLRAEGLPGKYAPDRAAALIRDAVYETLAAPRPRLGVAVCGSHCCFAMTLRALPPLRQDYDLIPILSGAAADTDTRFMAAEDFRSRLEELCGHPAIDSVAGAEPLGTGEALSALLIAPCTGNTLGKLANGITDGPVTMAAKAHLRNGRPLVLAISTNDGLSGSAENIGKLLQRKNVYFVPFRQDAPEAKPFSLQSDFSLLDQTVAAALRGRQLQPLLR